VAEKVYIPGFLTRMVWVFWDLLTSCCVRKEVTFDSGKLPQPFLNPAVMGQRRKQRAEREKKDQG